MFGEFVEADVAAVNGHGLGIGGEGDDAGAVVEFDEADFDFFGERGRPAVGIEAIDFEIVFAVGDDGAGEVEDFGEFVSSRACIRGRWDNLWWRRGNRDF